MAAGVAYLESAQSVRVVPDPIRSDPEFEVYGRIFSRFCPKCRAEPEMFSEITRIMSNCNGLCGVNHRLEFFLHTRLGDLLGHNSTQFPVRFGIPLSGLFRSVSLAKIRDQNFKISQNK